MEIQGTEGLKSLNEIRAKKAFAFISFFILILVAKLWQLQIFKGKELRAFSDQNTIKEQRVYAPRGYFLDRNGRTLVGSHPGYSLSLNPKIFRRQNRKKLDEVINFIAPILKKNPKALKSAAIKSYQKTGVYTSGVVSKELTPEQVLLFKKAKLTYPELQVEEVIFRNYPLKGSGAQIFGYVSTANKSQIKKQKEKGRLFKLGDQIGQTGLEQSLDHYIRGRDGISYVQVDAKGRVQNAANSLVNYIGLSNVEAQIGNNVVLTLDKDLQEKAFEAFYREDKIGTRKGGLVALNMQGEVLAWASNPTFDPSEFQTGISSETWKKLNSDFYKPLTDKVAQGTYSPGSVFKPLVGLAALHYKEITKYTKVDSPGSIRFGNRTYHDHKKNGHGVINLSEAIEVSGNVFFYKLGMALGVDKLANVISRLGIGDRTNMDYVTESKGLLPNTSWKKKVRKEVWQGGEDLSFAIGQGYILTNLLQLAKAYLTIASYGKVYKPVLVKEILNQNGESIKKFESNLIEDLTDKSSLGIKRKHFSSVIEGLIKVAHGDKGTARYRSSRKFLMAGKTGTVQVRNFSKEEIYDECEEREEKDRHHGVFVGFAPAEKPEIVVAALALHACHGSSGAAPMVTDVLKAYMKKHHPDLFKSKKRVKYAN